MAGNIVARAERLRAFAWTESAEDDFLEALANKGSVLAACRKVGCPRSSAYHRKDNDEAFAARWAEALRVAVARFEHAAIQRAVVGWEEPVFGPVGEAAGGGHGIVGYKRKFSDTLLLRVLSAHDERYRTEKAASPTSITVNVVNALSEANDRARAKALALRTPAQIEGKKA